MLPVYSNATHKYKGGMMKKIKTMRNFPLALVPLAWVFQQVMFNSADAAQSSNNYRNTVTVNSSLSENQQLIQATDAQLIGCLTQVEWLNWPCFFFDLVFSVSSFNAWAWPTATSMSASHV